MSADIQAAGASAVPLPGTGYRAAPLPASDGAPPQQGRSAASADLPSPQQQTVAQATAQANQAQTQQAPQKPAGQAEMERMRAAIQDLERKLSDARTDLQFRIDDRLHELIVSVVRSQDGTVVRQMPSEVALRIARLLDQKPGGLLETSA